MGVKEKTVRRIEMPKVEQGEVEIFTDAHIRKLLAACEKTRYPLRNRAIILLLLDTGVRAAELCFDSSRPEEQTGLLVESVVIGGPRSESYIIVMGKGRKSRTVGMGNDTRLAVQKYLIRERPRVEHPYLFIAKDRQPLTVRGLENFMSNLGETTKIQGVHPHRFRHTFAINQLMAGTSSLVLMQLMGHSTLEATKTYTRALTQMQARQASVSVVDRMRKSPEKSVEVKRRW